MSDGRLAKLHQFLLATAKDGYANINAPITRPPDGSHDLIIKQNPFTLHDNWFGGEPFGGREVVKDEKKAFWMMVYYGAISDPDEKPSDVYVALREALAKPDESMPVRGPKSYQSSNGYKYSFKWQGALDQFSGREWIENSRGDEIYHCEVSGGLIDL